LKIRTSAHGFGADFAIKEMDRCEPIGTYLQKALIPYSALIAYEETAMSKEKYRELIDQVCADHGFEPEADTYITCNVQMNGIPFMLMHGGVTDIESLYVYCEFGELPDTRGIEIMERLLETNLYFFGSNGPAYGFSSDTGCVLLMFRMAIPKITIQNIRMLMGQLMFQAHVWRKTYFLFGDDQAPMPSTSQPETRAAA
jgi:hypothetical protein